MEKIILNTDPEAAKFVENITGWVSRNGLFFGTQEDIARYDGCTHRACRDCGAATQKHYLICDDCSEKIAAARYEKLETAVWDENGMLYSDVADRYFSSW